MFSKAISKLTMTLSLTLALTLSLNVSAKDFVLNSLEHSKSPTFILEDFKNQKSYHDFIIQDLAPQMKEIAGTRTNSNETELSKGNGVSVKLNEENFNVHINFPDAAVGGRSYGWTNGKVGDWSDAMYLDKLNEVVQSGDRADIEQFFQVIVNMLGACDAEQLENLQPETQRVAANFLAIYSAEAYRATVPDAHMNWDDALLEVTLLGAFHGGQSQMTKFYLGEFTDTAKKQGSGVYAKTKPGPLAEEAADKQAELRDYWQFSANPTSKQSGINITRGDFEKMGEFITEYERSVQHNKALDKIFKIVGGDKKNVIKAISKYFTANEAQDVENVEKLSQAVSSLMLDIYDHAEEITEWIQSQK